MNKLIITTLSLAAAICLCGCQKESDGEYKLNDTDDVCTKMTDINFMRYCYTNFDVNGDGKVSMLEASAVKTIDCSEAEDFTGIEYFTNLEKLISSSVKKVDLTNNTKLTYIDLEYSPIEQIDLSNCKDLVTLKEMAFFDCTSLKSVSFPENLTTIESQAFYYCISLTSVSLPESLATIGFAAFGLCTGLMSIFLPDSLNTIEFGAFCYCTNLTSVFLPKDLTTIEYGLFYGCRNLTSVSFPESLTTIGSQAFRDCTSLMSVSFPESLTMVEGRAFMGCTSLSSVMCEAVLPPVLENGGFYFFYEIAPSAVLYVPAGSVELYEASDWAQWFSSIEAI